MTQKEEIDGWDIEPINPQKEMDAFIDEIKRQTAKEILNLLLTDYEPYIDKEIVKEIAKKVGVEL